MTRPFVLSAALTAALVIGACGGGGDDGASPTPSVVATTDESPTAAGVTQTPAPLDLPRTAVWGGMVVEAVSGVLSNVVPTTFGAADPEVTSAISLFLTLRIGFSDGFPARSADFRITNFALVSDGSISPAGSTDFSSSILLQAGEQAEIVLAFDPDDVDLTTVSLRYDDRAHVPMVLPLIGPTADDPYPVAVPLEVEATGVSYEGGCGDATGTARPLEAAFDLDGGIDHDGDTVVLNSPHRAENGKVFVRVTVQAVAVSGTCGGTIAGHSSFRLVADGLPTGPINRDTELLENGEGTEFVWGFAVPADVTELELEVGTTDGTTARFPIPIPDDLPVPA